MRRLLDRLLTLKSRVGISTVTSDEANAVLRKAFGVIYKKHKYNNFKILCIDAEQRGFTQAMEAYGEVALRLSAEIQHEAQ